jgi:hypothetical protein
LKVVLCVAGLGQSFQSFRVPLSDLENTCVLVLTKE